MISTSFTSGVFAVIPPNGTNSKTGYCNAQGDQADEKDSDKRNMCRFFPIMDEREIREFRFLEVDFFP